MDGHERLARPDLGEWTGGRAMSITDHARTNFNTLLRTASHGNLALMECADAVTGETRYVICTVGRDGGDFVMTPFGLLADGNPYEAYVTPPASGGPRHPEAAQEVRAGRGDRKRVGR